MDASIFQVALNPKHSGNAISSARIWPWTNGLDTFKMKEPSEYLAYDSLWRGHECLKLCGIPYDTCQDISPNRKKATSWHLIQFQGSWQSTQQLILLWTDRPTHRHKLPSIPVPLVSACFSARNNTFRENHIEEYHACMFVYLAK